MPERFARRHNAPESEIRKRGAAIVSGIALSVRTAQLYSTEHQNLAQALGELGKNLRALIESEREAEISRENDALFANGIRLQFDLGGMKTCGAALRILEERDIGSIRFAAVPSEAELRQLVELLAAPPGEGSDPWTAFEAQLRKLGLPGVRISKHEAPKEEAVEEEDDPRTVAIRLFFRAVEEVRNTLDDAAAGRKINFRRLKRIAQLIVDSVAQDPSRLLALVNVKEYGSRLANHLVNTAVLSAALGIRLGLPKKLLGHLVVSAMLHDLGCGCLPGPDGETGAALEEHAYRSVEILSRQKTSDALLHALVVAFLHHLRYDGTGYPRLPEAKRQNLCTRIVAIADAYDGLTSRRADADPGLRPQEAMRKLLEGAGTEFDPLLAKAFVELMGLYPVGCVVRLDTGELATVVAPPKDPRNADRPVVRLFGDASGAPADGTLDLAERADGVSRRSIAEVYREPEGSLRLEEYLSLV